MTTKLVLGLVVLSLVASAYGVVVKQLQCDPKSCAILGAWFPSSTDYLLLTYDGLSSQHTDSKKNNLWFSSDEGQTWKLVAPGVISVDVFENNPLAVVFSLNNGTMYASQDGGNTIKLLNIPHGRSTGFSLHSTKPGWIMSYYCNAYCIVYYSKDFGQSWQEGPEQVRFRGVLWGHDNNNPDLIFSIRYDNSFAYSKNYGNSWTSIIQKAIGFVLTDHYLYVGILVNTSSARLYSSSNRLDPSHTLPQYYWLDEFPTGNNLPESGYTFLDDTTRSEFIAVIQNGGSWGSLFSSDFDGDQFTLSLDYLVSYNMYYDFARFEGLNGMYITNSYDSSTSKNRRTRFSFDNGGEWKLLTAPTVGYDTKPTNCNINQGCSLHLHGQLSWYFGSLPHFYSSPNAIGMMVGVGNMGTGLTDDGTKSSTFLTRDAGVTWAQIYPEPTIYELGDHGGILVFATINTVTDTIHYSLDEGKTIVDEKFVANPIFVDNIYIEPSGSGRRFVLYGHSGANYYVFGLDFTIDMNLPICTDDDYEPWSPTNGDALNSNCFMGAVTTYRRRKQDAECYNDRDTDHFISQVPCKCAWEDYECDVGFSASLRNATDGFTCTSAVTRPACATGYRLIPDTMCNITGGLDLNSKSCPGYSGSGSTTGPVSTTSHGHGGDGNVGTVVTLVIFFILVGVAAGVGVLYWRNERFREWVLQKVARPRAHGYGRVNQAHDDLDDDIGN